MEHAITSARNTKESLSFLWLEITDRCNLECLHCYAESSPRKALLGQMEAEDWLAVIEQGARLGCKQIQFIGGEPTLHPELIRFVEFSALNNYDLIEVFTNLTRVNDRLINAFQKHSVRVATSFYSWNADTHNKITKVSDSFARTVTGIGRCIKAGLPLRVGIIEMAENFGHTNETIRYLETLGVTEIGVDGERAIGRGNRMPLEQGPMEQLCGECWKGKLCVTPSGVAYPCVFSRFAKLGEVKSGIDRIVSSTELKGFRDAVYRAHTDQSQNCIPDDPFCYPTSSSCGPETKCFPAQSRCQPDLGPCQPDIRPCEPQRRLI